MPAVTTHRLFGEESIERLPQGIVQGDEERMAFILGNQGPDPFFFRARTPRLKDCMTLGSVMHRSRISKQFTAYRDGVAHLQKADSGLGRAFALGVLSHYALDRNAHPFVYEQEFGICDADESLRAAKGKVHAVIESDLDVLMLQLKRNGATTAEYPPAGELVTSERINRVAGALMSFAAYSVYGINVPAAEFGGAVADMQFVYRMIEPAGSPRTKALASVEDLLGNHSLLESLAHRVTTEQPARTGNMGHLAWKDPFTGQESNESFPEVFDRALEDYAQLAARFIEGENMAQVTGHKNYSGRVLPEQEEWDSEE